MQNPRTGKRPVAVQASQPVILSLHDHDCHAGQKCKHRIDKYVIRPIETTQTANQLSAFGNGTSEFSTPPRSDWFVATTHTTVNIRGKEKHL